jgi:hypothetical protein
MLVAPASCCERASEEGLYRDHPMGLAETVLRDTAFTWQTRQTDHLRVHFQPGSDAARHMDQLVKDAEQGRENALRVLGEKSFGPRIDVFHLTSREQMKRITDYPVRGWTDPVSRTALLVRTSGSNQGERHEIAHVLSHNLWGHSRDWLTTGWMSEGLATYAGGPCSGHPIDQIVAYLDRGGQLIPLESLARKFRSYDDLMTYLQAGSFVGYIRGRYGLPALRALWEEGFDRLPAILGKDAGTVDAQWRTQLRKSYPDPKVDWAPIQAQGCR